MQQLELLARGEAAPAVPRRTPREKGEQAAKAALDKAERVAGFDPEGARKFILGWIARHGQTSGETLVDAAKQHGFRPGEDRAFGSIFATLVRRNEIRCVGYCLRSKGNSTAGGRVWGMVR